MEKKVKAIAFYLPQFHPTKENDIWWGKGFTEWTNVGKAKKLFSTHDQPKVPTELGYYNLLMPEIRRAQADLAKEAGIAGFCYWHYWFSGRKMLNEVFEADLGDDKNSFPFCLCWANHSWYMKTWTPDVPDKLLIKQEYPGRQDYENHFNSMLPAFKSNRYLRHDGKLVFGVFAGNDIPNSMEFFSCWQQLAEVNDLGGFYFLAFTYDFREIEKLKSMGYDDVIVDVIKEPIKQRPKIKRFFLGLRRKIFRLPALISYDIYVRYCIKIYSSISACIPCILPNFDHTPRSGRAGIVLTNTKAQKWGRLIHEVKKVVEEKYSQNGMIFLKAWNEWGEGNYLEPDLTNGREFLTETRRNLE